MYFKQTNKNSSLNSCSDGLYKLLIKKHKTINMLTMTVLINLPIRKCMPK